MFAEGRLLSLLLSLLLLLHAFSARGDEAGKTTLYVCEAGDPTFMGAFLQGSETMDGMPVFSNANDRSFFRNKGFWYLGDLGPWPPETHYRCVEAEGCNPGGELPPTTAEGAWTASKRFGKEPVPVITSTPCSEQGKGTDEL